MATAEVLTIFNQVAAVCPPANQTSNSIITVLVDECHQLGKQFEQRTDGTVTKASVVRVARATACQFLVPDHATLKQVLRIVGEHPNAAICPDGWLPVPVGQQFIFVSQQTLIGMKLHENSVTEIGGIIAFARLKEHARPSNWKLLDRDEDESTPGWAQEQSFNVWQQNVDIILPGFSKVTVLRAHSSTARVIKADGTPVGGGNSHVWLKIAEPTDTERTRTAIIARAIEHNLAWRKPRFSKSNGQIVGHGWATIIDQSVWTPGRLAFVGQPTCSGSLSIAPQQFELIRGELDELDTSQAVISSLNTYRASVRQGTALIVSQKGDGCSVIMRNLRMDTEIELADGSVKTVSELMADYSGKIRCQAPFRASSSMAAFLSLDRRGNPFVFDSGTNTKHVLNRPVANDSDSNEVQLVAEVKSRVGSLIGFDIANAVVDDEILTIAWQSCFFASNNNRVVFINDSDELTELSSTDAVKFGFRRAFGQVFNWSLIAEAIAEQVHDSKAVAKLNESLKWLEYGPLLESLKLYKQAKVMEVEVDMFIHRGTLRVMDGVACIKLPHRRLVASLNTDAAKVKAVLSDYLEHFPEFTALLDLILYARFASDRRHAFVWLHAVSSWGKGFLLAIFGRLQLVLDISAAEIEKAIAGGPAGISMVNALRAWILFVDEFKSASSELKLLNNSISIAPKHQLRCSIQLYTKLFCSAESVRSLVGDGVEAQFNNRFAYLSPSTSEQGCKIEDRPLFRDQGKAAYLDVIVFHVANYLNAGVDRMRSLGPFESSKVADAHLESYQAMRRLNIVFGNLDESIDALVSEIKQCLVDYAHWHFITEGSSERANEMASLPDSVKGIGLTLLNFLKRNAVVGMISVGEGSKTRHKALLLGNPVQFVKGYLNLSPDKSTAAKLNYKADDITALLHTRPGKFSSKVRVYSASGNLQRGKEIANKSGAVIFLDPTLDVRGDSKESTQELIDA